MGAGAHLEVCYTTYVHKQGHARGGMDGRKNAEPFAESASAWQYPSTETGLTSRCERAKSRSRENEVIVNRWPLLQTREYMYRYVHRQANR